MQDVIAHVHTSDIYNIRHVLEIRNMQKLDFMDVENNISCAILLSRDVMLLSSVLLLWDFLSCTKIS